MTIKLLYLLYLYLYIVQIALCVMLLAMIIVFLHLFFDELFLLKQMVFLKERIIPKSFPSCHGERGRSCLFSRVQRLNHIKHSQTSDVQWNVMGGGFGKKQATLPASHSFTLYSHLKIIKGSGSQRDESIFPKADILHTRLSMLRHICCVQDLLAGSM